MQLLKTKKMELESLGRDIERLQSFAESEFERISYDDAINRLKEFGQKSCAWKRFGSGR